MKLLSAVVLFAVLALMAAVPADPTLVVAAPITAIDVDDKVQPCAGGHGGTHRMLADGAVLRSAKRQLVLPEVGDDVVVTVGAERRAFALAELVRVTSLEGDLSFEYFAQGRSARAPATYPGTTLQISLDGPRQGALLDRRTGLR